MKAATCYSAKSFFKKSFPTTATRFFQLRTYPTTGEVSHQYLLTITNQCSSLSKLNYFSLYKKRFAATTKTQVSPYDPTKLAFHSILRPEDDLISNCGQNFEKTVSFDDIVQSLQTRSYEWISAVGDEL